MEEVHPCRARISRLGPSDYDEYLDEIPKSGTPAVPPVTAPPGILRAPSLLLRSEV